MSATDAAAASDPASAAAAAPSVSSSSVPASVDASASSSVPRGVAMLRALSPVVPFEVREYAYIEKGGTGASSVALGLVEHAVVKTLCFQESESGAPFIVLQHGDASCDTKKLIRELERTRGMHSGAEGSVHRSAPDAVHVVALAAAAAAAAAAPAAGSKPGKSAAPAKVKSRAFMTDPAVAQEATGYLVGGTSPFGLRDPRLRIFIEASLLRLAPAPVTAAEQEAVQSGQVPVRAEPRATVLPLDAAHLAAHMDDLAHWSASPATPAFSGETASLSPDQLASVSPAWVCINGGARGTLVALSVRDIVRVLRPIVVEVSKGGAAATAAAAAAPAASSSSSTAQVTSLESALAACAASDGGGAGAGASEAPRNPKHQFSGQRTGKPEPVAVEPASTAQATTDAPNPGQH